MLNFMKRKKITSSIIAIALIGIFATVVYAAYNERQVTVFWNKVTFKKILDVQDELKFSPDAIITSTKDVNPRNYINNSELAIWSGGTSYGVGARASVPDGWYIPGASTYTGVTRIDVNTIAPVSSVTPSFTHSMYANVWSTATGQSAATKFLLYPGSGVSAAASWYKKFAGKNVTFGAWMKRDITVSVAAGVSTNFIRPVMNSHSVHLSACSTYWKLGDFVENDGWTLATATWDVPADASAFECGFAMNPTVLAPKTTSGDSVYIVAPFLLINPLHKKYVPRNDEVVFFTNTVNPFGAYSSGGSTFGVGTGGSLDLSADNGWGGKIPDDTKAIYATVAVNASWPNSLYMYGDNILGGVSFYTTASGASPQATTSWIPVSSSGTINVANPTVAFSGTSMFVHGARIR